MARPPSASGRTRLPLTRDRVLRAAVELVDEGGLAALSMRKLGRRVGVEAMSLYNHVANKEDILDGIVELILAEVALPEAGEPWPAAMRRRALSARAMFLRHPWATTVLESRRNPGPASLRYHDAVIGCLRRGGFSIAMAAHAFSLLDAYTLGFAITEANLPFRTTEELADLADGIMEGFDRDAHPYFTEMVFEHVLQPGYAHGDEFEFGLTLILDGLGRRIGLPDS